MICPEFFGCSGKLDFGATRDLVRWAGLEPLGDYSVSRSGKVAMSIDRVGQCSKDATSFAQIALTHACRDLEAGFIKPTDALICYEFGPETDGREQAEIVRSVTQAAGRRKIAIGKCHSVLVEGSTSIVICVLGDQTRLPATLPEAGTVWLSHALGAAKLQYMSEIGTLSDVSPYYDLMTSEVDTNVFANLPCVISDVSGHGLAGTLVDIAERFSLSIAVTISPATAAAPIVLLEEISLFENDPASYGPSLQLDDDARALALLKETAGPLLALSGPVDEKLAAAISQAGWLEIGQYERGPVGVRVQWRG